jgi:hypothetical protein
MAYPARDYDLWAIGGIIFCEECMREVGEISR